MTKEDYLQSVILSQYKSVMSFAKEIDVPYTTIKGMLSRGVDGTSVQTVLKVCTKLGISVQDLISEEFNKNLTTSVQTKVNTEERNKTEGLTDKESKMIKKYRLLDPRGQQAVDDTLERELSYIIKDKNMVDMSMIACDAIDTIDMISESMFKNQHNSVLKK